MLPQRLKNLLSVTYSKEVVEFVKSLDKMDCGGEKCTVKFPIGNLIVDTSSIMDQLEFLIQTDGHWNIITTGVFNFSCTAQEALKHLLSIAFPLGASAKDVKRFESAFSENSVTLKGRVVLNNKAFVYELSVLPVQHGKRDTNCVMPSTNMKHLFLTNVVEIKKRKFT